MPMRSIHVKVGKDPESQKQIIVPVDDVMIHTDRQTDKIATLKTRKGLASLAPMKATSS